MSAAEPSASEPSAGETLPAPDFLTAGTGPRILFSSARSGQTDIYRMAPDGSGLVRVASFAGLETWPAWSWDNKRIAMERTRLNDHQRGRHGAPGDPHGLQRLVRPAVAPVIILSPLLQAPVMPPSPPLLAAAQALPAPAVPGPLPTRSRAAPARAAEGEAQASLGGICSGPIGLSCWACWPPA